MKISISNPLVRDAIYLAYKGECFYTGRPVARDQMEIDHLIPVSKNGKDCFENYVLTFKNLNVGKRNKIDSRRIDRMQSVVEHVYAPRAKKIFESLNKIKTSKKNLKQQSLILLRRDNLFWADDNEIEILTDSPLVNKTNSYELLFILEKFIKLARDNDSDFCIDAWITKEQGEQFRSIWYRIGSKYFRVVKKIKYYNPKSLDKWAYLYFTQEFLSFLNWKDNENEKLEEISELEDEEEHIRMLREFCTKYPPPEKYRKEILNKKI